MKTLKMQTRRDWLKASIGLGGLVLSPNISLTAKEIENYRPRKLQSVVRLSSNENPYGPSKKVLNRIKDSFKYGCRYPSSFSDELANILAKKHNVSAESIIITGGSREGLKITALTYTKDGVEIIAGYPTYLTMMKYAEHWGASINWVPVDENKSYNLDEIEKRISAKTKLVFLCNPNNPTGTIVPAKKLVDFCDVASKKTIVFSDEAYYDYIETPNYPSMIDAVRRGDNVIVSKTFSKVYGMAGLRLGYLIAKPEIAKKIRKNVVAMSNILAIEAAKEALNDNSFYKFSISKNKQEKQRIYTLLDHLKLDYVPSHTNFIFFHSKKDIKQFGSQMLAKGVSVGRPFPPFNDWCRISTGTADEVDKFINGMLEVYKG